MTSPWQFPIFKPVVRLVEIIRPLFLTGQPFRVIAVAFLRLTWFLSVWSVFAGAITRMSAFNVARDDAPGMFSAIKYSIGRFRDYMTAPFLACVGIGCMWLLCCLTGLMSRIPWVGEFGVAVVWLIPLAMGAVIAAVLVAFVLGWPFSNVTVSTEGADGFDAFSRPLNYIFTQPWRYVFHWLLACVHGGLVIGALILFWALVVHMTGWAVGAGMSEAKISEIIRLAPNTSDGMLPSIVDDLGTTSTVNSQAVATSSRIAAFWFYMAASLIGSFGACYFWCSATVNYFLIRHHEDAVEFEEVFVDAPTDEPDLALSGIAASNIPAAERPVRATSGTTKSEESNDPVTEPASNSDKPDV